MPTIGSTPVPNRQPLGPCRLASGNERLEVAFEPRRSTTGAVTNFARDCGGINYSGDQFASFARTGSASGFSVGPSGGLAGAAGYAAQGDGTAANYWNASYPGPPDVGGAADESFTIHFRAYLSDFSSTGGLASWGEGGAVWTNPLFLFATHSSNTARFLFMGAYRETTTLSASGGIWDVVFTYRREEDEFQIVVNGQPRAPVTFNYYSVYSSAVLYVGSGYNSSLKTGNRIHWLRIWRNTKMTPSQMVALYERPWSIYEPVARPMWFLPAAPAGGAIAPIVYYYNRMRAA